MERQDALCFPSHLHSLKGIAAKLIRVTFDIAGSLLAVEFVNAADLMAA